MTIKFPSERKRRKLAFWTMVLAGCIVFSWLIPVIFKVNIVVSPAAQPVSLGSTAILGSEKLNNLETVQIQPTVSPVPTNQPADQTGTSSFQASQSDLAGQTVGRINPFSPYQSPANSPVSTPANTQSTQAP